MIIKEANITLENGVNKYKGNEDCACHYGGAILMVAGGAR